MQGDKAGQWFNREDSSLYLSLTRGKSVVSVWKYELHFIPPPIDIYIILGGSQLIVTLLAPREGGGGQYWLFMKSSLLFYGSIL